VEKLLPIERKIYPLWTLLIAHLDEYLFAVSFQHVADSQQTFVMGEYQAINPPGMVRTTLKATGACIWPLAQSLVLTFDILGLAGRFFIVVLQWLVIEPEYDTIGAGFFKLLQVLEEPFAKEFSVSHTLAFARFCGTSAVEPAT